MSSLRNVVIIGSGPAGLTAALYTARANLKPLVIEGLEAGGQLMMTTLVENWPSYKNGIDGPELIAEIRAQAERFGTEIIRGQVTDVDVSRHPFTITTSDAQYRSRTLIIATGASARLLGIPSERTLMGHGVSTCATCDGYFFRGKPIAVVGGPLRTGRASAIERVIRIQIAPHGALNGGVLIDSSGQALGIVTSMAIRGTTVVIPASIAWAAASKVASDGGTRQGFLGISSMAVPLPERQRAGRSIGG